MMQIPKKDDDSPLLMSAEELRAYEGYENMSDEEAKEYISIMQRHCMITYEVYMQDRPKRDGDAGSPNK